MFFNNLLEASIIELCEFGQVVDVSDDIAKVLLEYQEILFGGRIDKGRVARVARLLLVLLLAIDDIVHLFIRSSYAAGDVIALDVLKGKDLVEFLLELADEAAFVVFVP